MSNAEESYVFNKQLDKKILDLIKAYISESPHSASGSAFQKSLYEIMQEHTNQTLDELKEKVKLRKMNIDPDDNRVMAGRNYELEWIITLIDEAINE